MIRRAPWDLVRQLRVLIAEEAFLGDLTMQVTDYHGGGERVVHGPWQAGDCQRVLLRWFGSGLVDCIAIAWAAAAGSREIIRYEYDASWRSRAAERDDGFLVLGRDDARALLSDPAAWGGRVPEPESCCVSRMRRKGCRSMAGSTRWPDCRRT